MTMRRIDAIFKQLALSEEQVMIRDMTRDFAAAEIGPNIVGWERERATLPDRVIGKMGELGLFGITTPEQHGGTGGGMRELILAGMELGYHSPAVGITLGARAEADPDVRRHAEAIAGGHEDAARDGRLA